MSKISICIPTTELIYSDGTSMGVYMLNFLLKSIEMQTFTDYEVIISDHSKSDIIEDECKDWEHLNLKYFRNTSGVGSAAKNLNFAISKASGEYVKTILQDDFFHAPNALEYIIKNIKSEGWVVTGTNHCNENETDKLVRSHTPRWIDPIRMLSGVNTLSGPSVVLFKNDGNLFDEDLGWLNDVEFYYRLFLKYGEPLLLSKKVIVQRLRKEGVSNVLENNLKREESQYVMAKHGITDGSKDLSDYPSIFKRINKL